MTANRPATPLSSGEVMGETDLAKVDAHVIRPEEYEDLPELTDDMLAGADLHVGGRLVRRGRPPLSARKRQVTIRLDPDVLEQMRATGAGWQSRINDAVREWLKRRAA